MLKQKFSWIKEFLGVAVTKKKKSGKGGGVLSL